MKRFTPDSLATNGGSLRCRTTTFGSVAILLISGCASLKRDPTSTPPPVAPSEQAAAKAAEIERPAAVEQSTRASPAQSSNPVTRSNSAADVPRIANEQAPKAAPTQPEKVAPPKNAASTKPDTVSANAPAKAAPSTAVSTTKPVTPTSTLDLATLEQRLRDTRAIGAFTKLSLKNQVDDLLDEFQDFYRGKAKTSLTALRQRYDLLMMKVLSLLQDGDAALAASISSSREAIWGILKDPKQFSQIRSG